MPPRNGVLLLALAALVVAGCSRLTFIKPKMDRGKFTRVAPEYDVREDRRDRQRIAAMDAQALA
ncbi:MAG TPA: type IV pilus biogenesis/stability protein PilW, partial [Xanthomonadaceae bacterium]|nr:type IV pilus biogenesis/stability protein PilW [Xanthomonadaceae bacterium]